MEEANCSTTETEKEDGKNNSAAADVDDEKPVSAHGFVFFHTLNMCNMNLKNKFC